MNSPINEWLTEHHAHVVDEVAGFKIVGAIHHNIVPLGDRSGIVGIERHRIGIEGKFGVEFLKVCYGGFGFRFASFVGGV